MSRQFRFFLLPVDIENFTRELRDQVEIRVFQEKSATREIVAIESPLKRFSNGKDGSEIVSVYCLLAPAGATINVNYYPTLGEWLIDEEKSEVIQFCGCRFDSETLHIGRFYAMTDMLIGDTIWRKQDSFLKWVDCVYRAAKKSLKYSRELQAYIGPAAEEWIRRGGNISEI
jgi:hypothetical protein